MKNSLSKQSLYVTLGITIVSVVCLLILILSLSLYVKTKSSIIQDIKHSSSLTIASLQKNISKLIEAYAINDYNLLTKNEMGHRDILAIIVEDYNMGKILGEKLYITGKIRDSKWHIIDYDHQNITHAKQLENAFHTSNKDIINSSGQKIGRLTLYSSDTFLKQELIKLVNTNLINAAIISILLILSLFYLIQSFILHPLHNISQIINTTEKDGIPTSFVPIKGSKEVVTFSKALNKMIDTIKESRRDLYLQHKELDFLAHHDSLTSLPNRFLFNDRLKQSLSKSKRNKTKTAVLFLDLDRFKEINDSLGHQTGDRVLQVISKRLLRLIRDEDTLARLGGDEFSIIIEELVQYQDAIILAQKILDELLLPIQIDENSLYISTSIGISIFPDDGETAENLLKNADAAMYKAKEEGKNNFQFYSHGMTTSALEKVQLEANLRKALSNNEFTVYYQPQINSITKILIGMEALVRWNHPTQGLIPPIKFIPLAESTGLIIELDQFVMKTAMQQLSNWYRKGFKPGKLSLNLAMKQLQQQNFINILDNLIEETGCLTEWLEFEVTETQMMTNPELAIETLNKLSQLGVSIAIDDFGTGYSSLSYLKKLPINKLKIDKIFIDELPKNDDDIAITKAIIALGKTLKMTLLAEGVESIEQRDFLIENDCPNIQGYLYSKPLPQNEMEVFITKSYFSSI